MSARIALLRGINVGGHAQVSMAELRALFAGIGLGDARTVLQSGNVVFTGTGGAVQLEARLEKEVANRFGLNVDVLVRSSDEWTKIIAANPFAEEAKRDPSHVLVMLLKQAPAAGAVAALPAAVNGPEQIRAAGAQLYLTYPAGIGRSKLTGALIEKTLRITGTARNWNTVLKLGELTRARES